MSFYRGCAVLILSSVVVLQSCTQIDNYMLGKDNTPEPSPLKSITPTLSLVEKWSVFTGKPGKSNDALKLGPVIYQGVVYSASVDGTVQATHQADGKVVWSKPLPHHLMSGPSVNSGYIAVTTSNSTVIILNQADGSIHWQANLSSDSLARPVIKDNTVFIKTIDGNLYAFNLKTGEKRWVVDHGSPHLILQASSSPVIFDNLALVGFSDGKLDAIERDTGRVLWQRNISFAAGSSDVENLVDIDADPIVRGDHVYLASYQGYIGALSLKNGEFTWRKRASIYKNMADLAGTLYYVDNDSVIWARNGNNGHVKWKQEDLKVRGLTEPVLMGNRLFVGDKSGYLHGLNLSNGQLVSRTFLGAPILAAPVVSGANIYVLTSNGKLTRLSAG